MLSEREIYRRYCEGSAAWHAAQRLLHHADEELQTRRAFLFRLEAARCILSLMTSYTQISDQTAKAKEYGRIYAHVLDFEQAGKELLLMAYWLNELVDDPRRKASDTAPHIRKSSSSGIVEFWDYGLCRYYNAWPSAPFSSSEKKIEELDKKLARMAV